MRPEHLRVFNHFREWDVAIVGSSLRDYETANDIDVLFPAATDFRKLAGEVLAKYLGKFVSPTTGGDVRRLADLTLDGIRKPVQCISDSTVATFEQWPHIVLLRDGKLLNTDKHHVKGKGHV